MMLNKSIKSTPSSRSGYLYELNASTGKQNNFLFPVRIKVTPNNTINSYSDGKKNHSKKFQPVLIKDLLQSNQKEKQYSTIRTISTQKKKFRKSTQCYLNGDNYKITQEAGLDRKSFNGNKVRRKLYQTLDTTQKPLYDGKGNANKVTKPKKKMSRNSEECGNENKLTKNNRQSLLLPCNSIKNNFIRKSTSNYGQISRQSIKSSTSNMSKQIKRISNATGMGKLINEQKNSCTERLDAVDMEIDFSSSELDKKDKQDKCTMTSPSIDRSMFFNKSLSGISELEQQSIANASSKLIFETKQANNLHSSFLGVENIINHKMPSNGTEITVVHNQNSQNSGFNSINIDNLNCGNLSELKSYLEQSIQACENQTLILKQTLNVVNRILNITTNVTDVSCNNGLEVDEKSNVSNVIINNHDNSNITNSVDNCLQNISVNNEQSTLVTNISKVECTKNIIFEVEENLPTCKEIFFQNEESNKKGKDSSETYNDLIRLSTIGEVSYEGDEFNKNGKDDSGNKEDVNTLQKNISLNNSNLPKNLPNRSAEDSFIQLENELNVQHNTLQPKSLPASPIRKCMTPASVKLWDKKVQRPLKEYMDLKMNGTLLVTPDIKKFQSCLESTDTPHSRKSLSRKIFMELCDLYGESPEYK